MPQPTFVHIQSSDNAPIRVIELPQGPIRVGRGAHCEIRLDDPKLGEVQCILRDRGTSWSFQPVGPTGQVWIDGRPAEAQGPVRMGVPFRVGQTWITLRSAENAFNEYGSFASPISVEPQPATILEPETPPPSAARTPAADRLDRWQNRLDQREKWVRTARTRSAGKPDGRRPARRSGTSRPPRRPLRPRRSGRRSPPSAPRSRPAPPELRPVARIVEPRTPEPVRRAADPVRPPLTVRVRPVPPTQPQEAPVSTSRSIVCLPSTKPPASLRSEIAPGPIVAESQPAIELAEPPTTISKTNPIEVETPVIVAPKPTMPGPVSPPEPIAPVIRKAEPARPAIADPPRLDPPPSTEATPNDWPSARTIFAAQGNRSAPVGDAVIPKKRRATAPEPTEARAPARWTLPLWVGLVPTTAFVLLVGVAALALSVDWAQESNAANLAIRAATRDEKTAGPRLDPTNIPRGGWWRSTAPHLSAWALAMARATDGEDHSEDLRLLMEGAKHASPLASNTRFLVEPAASADLGPGAGFSHLGRPRDVITLAWTGRRLRRAGKVEASLRAYRSAMEMAARVEPRNLEAPAFVDDSKTQVRRYLFPHEGLIRLVVRDMVESGEWTHEQWAATLPGFAVAPLAAATEVRAKDRVESDRLLDLAIAQGEDTKVDGAEHLAATAEAMATRGRWTDSADRYRRAIEAEADDACRRMWWLNLAEVARKWPDDKLRARAIESAKAPESGDEITRRAIGYQQILAAPSGSRASRP